MKRKVIEESARLHANVWVGTELRNFHRKLLYEEAFADGAEWRAATVWNEPYKEPARFCDLLLIEHKNGEFELAYKFDPANTKRWAYVKNLMPEMEE